MGYFDHQHGFTEHSVALRKTVLLLGGIGVFNEIQKLYFDSKRYNEHVNRHDSHAHQVTMPVDSVHANTTKPFNLDRHNANIAEREAMFAEAREDEYLGGFF